MLFNQAIPQTITEIITLELLTTERAEKLKNTPLKPKLYNSNFQVRRSVIHRILGVIAAALFQFDHEILTDPVVTMMAWFHNDDPSDLVDRIVIHHVYCCGNWQSGFRLMVGKPGSPGEVCATIYQDNTYAGRYEVCSGNPNDVPTSGWVHIAFTYSDATGKEIVIVC